MSLGSLTVPSLKDSAVLSGGSSPTGTITFTLFVNGGNTPVDTETVTVNGNGRYQSVKRSLHALLARLRF